MFIVNNVIKCVHMYRRRTKLKAYHGADIVYSFCKFVQSKGGFVNSSSVMKEHQGENVCTKFVQSMYKICTKFVQIRLWQYSQVN